MLSVSLNAIRVVARKTLNVECYPECDSVVASLGICFCNGITVVHLSVAIA